MEIIVYAGANYVGNIVLFLNRNFNLSFSVKLYFLISVSNLLAYVDSFPRR